MSAASSESLSYDPTLVDLPKMADALSRLECLRRDNGDGTLSSPCAFLSIGAVQAAAVSASLHDLASKFEPAEQDVGGGQSSVGLMLGEHQLAAVISALRGASERMRSPRFYATGEMDSTAAGGAA